MVPYELELLLERFRSARRPEDVFGELGGDIDEQLQQGRKLYRRLSRQSHPDHNEGAPEASEASALLNAYWDQTQQAIKAGTYGSTPVTPIAAISSKRHAYEILEAVPGGDIANLYWARSDHTDHALIKVARSPRDADLMEAEVKTLKVLYNPGRPEGKSFLTYFPVLIESFGFREASTGVVRRANVFEGAYGFYSLADVREAYPDGIHPKDMAWMFRRLLDALGYVHTMKIVHGAVLPTHVLIHPEQHRVMLVDWFYSLCDVPDSAQHIKAVSLDYKDWYPPEVAAKQTPTAGTDILMAARCMVAIMGGDPLSGQLPSPVPRRLQGFLKACLIVSPRQRPQDAWQLRAEFTELIEQLWGKREFRPFHMP